MQHGLVRHRRHIACDAPVGGACRDRRPDQGKRTRPDQRRFICPRGRTAPELAPELATDVRAGRVPTALPGDDAFRSTAAGLPQAYEEGWLACRMIADQWSPDTLTAFYRAVAQGGTLDSRLQAALGLSLSQFTARWRSYVTQELG